MKQCAAFWNHTNLRSGDRIYPCCRFKEPIQQFDGNLGTILDSDAYVKLRSLDTVENLSSCSKCMHEESNGKESLRQKFNKEYTTDTVELRYFEVGFDNICNLTCDGCWEEWSHSWALKKYPTMSKKDVIVSTSEILTTTIPDSIERIVFLGGEPLMTNRHIRLLSSIHDLSNLTVEYYTNGTYQLTDAAHKLLSKCKHVHFTVSIDGYGALNDKVRSGSSWQDVEAFCASIVKIYNMSVHTTLHKNNWQGLPDMNNWVTNNNYNWTLNVLTYPTLLDIKTITFEEKNALINIVNDYNIPDALYIKEHLNGCE